MSEDGVKPKKERKIGILMPESRGLTEGKPSGGQLVLKPAQEHHGATTPDEREEQQTEEERVKKAFNSIPKLKKILLQLFNQTEWEFTDHGTKFTFVNKENNEQVIKVEKLKDEIRFSGTPMSKLVEAANHYESQVDIELEFEVGANTLEDAKAFMIALHENGFDIRKITALNLRTKAEYDIQELIAEITHTPAMKGKRARPGGKQKAI